MAITPGHLDVIKPRLLHRDPFHPLIGHCRRLILCQKHIQSLQRPGYLPLPHVRHTSSQGQLEIPSPPSADHGYWQLVEQRHKPGPPLRLPQRQSRASSSLQAPAASVCAAGCAAGWIAGGQFWVVCLLSARSASRRWTTRRFAFGSLGTEEW